MTALCIYHRGCADGFGAAWAIAEPLNTTTRPMIIGGYCVPIANLPYTLASDAGHALCRGDGGGMAPPFAGI